MQIIVQIDFNYQRKISTYILWAKNNIKIGNEMIDFDENKINDSTIYLFIFF